MGDTPRYAVDRIAATHLEDRLLSHRIPLPEPARELLEMRKTVLVDQAAVIPGNIIVQGRLRVQYLLSLPRGSPPPVSCSPPLVHLSTGLLTEQTAELAFDLHMPVPAASPDMRCEITDAFVAADNSSIAALDSTGLIICIHDQSLLRIGLKLLAKTLLSSPAPTSPAPPSQPPVATRFGHKKTRRP